MIFCQYQEKFGKLSFLRMHALADFAADFDHDYNHSLPPASIEVPRYAAICIAILNRTPYGLPSFPRPQLFGHFFETDHIFNAIEIY